jgi:hypothetical protein
MTSLTGPSGLQRVASRELRGFGAREVSAWREAVSALGGEGHRVPVPSENDVEPLYLEHALHCLDDAQPPASLDDLVAARVNDLLPDERRVLQALAVTGSATREMVTHVLDEKSADAALEGLIAAGLIEATSGTACIKHRFFAEKVLALAPAGALSLLHERAAAASAEDPTAIELRAFHALNAQPNFETFLLVEAATQQRVLRGDDDGAVALLTSALDAAAAEGHRGDVAAESAKSVFARKIGMALVNGGRFQEAIEVLEIAVHGTETAKAEKALVLEQLAIAYASAGRGEQAVRRQEEALACVNASGDTSMIRRLTSPPKPRPSQALPRLFSTSSAITPALTAIRDGTNSKMRIHAARTAEGARRRDPRRDDD